MPPAQVRAAKIIYDLVQIHRERIGLYQDAQLTSVQSCPYRTTILGDITRQSSRYIHELTHCLPQPKGDPAMANDKIRRKGNVYSTWMRTKASIGGDDHKSILASCRAEGEAVQYAYIAALSLSEYLETTIRRLIETQFYGLKSTLDSIEEYHDAL